jgi:aminopeptidase N
MRVSGPYDPRAEDAGRRAFGATLLRLQTRLDGGVAAREVFGRADNMTERMAAFACLLEAGDEAVAGEFERDWQHDRLVMDKWFGAQVVHAVPGDAVEVAERLTRHPLFDAANPNRFRAVIGGLVANAAGFHRADGRSYAFVADRLIELDGSNPQTAARMSSAFETWRRWDADRQAFMGEALERMRDGASSRDLREMVDRMLST